MGLACHDEVNIAFSRRRQAFIGKERNAGKGCPAGLGIEQFPDPGQQFP